MDELKPCPFCGSSHVGVMRDAMFFISGVYCYDCKSLTRWDITPKSKETYGENQDDWTRHWNRRADNA